jgi:hypothetical protein
MKVVVWLNNIGLKMERQVTQFHETGGSAG